jgi:CHAD domain-containing protein
VNGIEWNARASAAANARRELPRIVADYFSEVRKALEAKPSPASLHEIRLVSKKVRYTLELFKSCYGPAFGERMQALKDVQASLGEVSDAVAAANLIRDIMPPSARRKALRAYLKKRAAQKAEEFRSRWVERFDAEGEERRWMEFLKKPKQAARRANKALGASANAA